MTRRKSVTTMLAGAIALIALAGCGLKSTPVTSSPSQKASRAKPVAIIPTPANTLDASYPEPNGTMWVVAGSAGSHGIYQVNLSHKKLGGSVSVSNNANTIAESSTGILGMGISTAASGAVQFLNGSSGAPLKTVPVDGPVTALATGSDGITFYALNGTAKAKNVAIINAQTDKVDATIAAPSDAVSVVPAPNQQSVYVLEPNGVVSQITTAGGHISTQFPIGNSGIDLAIDPNGNTLYVLKGQGITRNVAVVNLAKEAVTEVLPAPANTQAIALSPNGQVLYDIVGTTGVGNIQEYSLR